MRKTKMFTQLGDFEFNIGPTECGQIVVLLTPGEWEALPPDIQETVVAIDILLAREWVKENTLTGNVEIVEENGGQWLNLSNLH